MQPFIMQCRVQAAFKCNPPEPPIGPELRVTTDSVLRKSRPIAEKPPPVNSVVNNVDTSTDGESFNTDAKSSPEGDTEFGDMTDGPPLEECIDQTWTYDSIGGAKSLRFKSYSIPWCSLLFKFDVDTVGIF